MKVFLLRGNRGKRKLQTGQRTAGATRTRASPTTTVSQPRRQPPARRRRTGTFRCRDRNIPVLQPARQLRLPGLRAPGARLPGLWTVIGYKL